jgi:WhiB family redox-sensing transcriptional regulator
MSILSAINVSELGNKNSLYDLADAVTQALPCHNSDPDLFFSEQASEIELAKSICQLCPQRSSCLQSAIARGEAAGVWGGELFDEGRPVRIKRRAGRPSFASLAADKALAGKVAELSAIAS